MRDDKLNSSGADTGLTRGAVVDRYVVLRMVGRGGMGDVYAAYDPDLDRKVAIKLLRARPGPGQDRDAGATRLLREAQAIAKLSHPNVVVVYDVGRFGDQVFLAMEFIEGHTITYWMHQQPRAWTDVLKVFIAAGHGLAAAHEKDVVHRDFKPDNVMVNATGQVRVMDFGLARLAAARQGHGGGATIGTGERLNVSGARAVLGGVVDATLVLDATSAEEVTADPSRSGELFLSPLTESGSVVGTPAYMAPEQFLGRAVGPAADQFSFCVALYEALYRVRPFEGNTVSSLMRNVVAGAPRLPPVTVDVPSWVRRALLRGICVSPADRWPSMNDLLAELEKSGLGARRRRFAAGAAAKLTGVWEAPRRGRATLTATKAAMRLAFLATGKAYAETAFANVRRILDAYARSWADMYIDACVATHVRGEQSAEVLDLRMAFLQGALQALKAACSVLLSADGDVLDNAVRVAGSLPDLSRCADIAFLRAGIRPPEDPATRAAVDHLRAELASAHALMQVGRLAAAREGAELVEKEARKLGYRPLIAEALLRIADVLAERREFDESARKYQEAVWAAQGCRHDEIAATAAAQLVAIGAELRRLEEGEIWAQYAETTLERIGGHASIAAWLFTNRGNLRRLQGRVTEALADCIRGMALKEEAFGADHPDVAYSLINLALFHAEAGDLEAAASFGARSVDALERLLGPQHPRVAHAQANLAETLNGLGRHEEARELSRKALAVFEAETDPDGVFSMFARAQLGLALLGGGRVPEALQALEPVVAKAGGGELMIDATARFALARAVWQLGGDDARALALAEEARQTLADLTPARALLSELEGWLRERRAGRAAAASG